MKTALVGTDEQGARGTEDGVVTLDMVIVDV